MILWSEDSTDLVVWEMIPAQILYLLCQPTPYLGARAMTSWMTVRLTTRWMVAVATIHWMVAILPLMGDR
jgi:hypothetical protein